MIQRIQTIYLLISTIFLILVSFNDCIKFLNAGDDCVYKYSTMDSPVVMTILIITILLTFGSIFLFNKRVLQMRVVGFATILVLLNIIAFAVFVAMDDCMDYSISITWATFLPIVSVVMNLLAIKAIGIDEAKVRSLNRLR